MVVAETGHDPGPVVAMVVVPAVAPADGNASVVHPDAELVDGGGVQQPMVDGVCCCSKFAGRLIVAGADARG